MFYQILGWMVRLIVRIFYRRIEFHGLENVPRSGALLFASNHPNMLLDPFMVGLVASGRPVHFLGKSTLFAFPPLGWLLRTCGVIPVYRRQDDPKQMGKNDLMFSACYEVLGRGEVLGIFPEGVSERGPHLRPLKTGAARIVLEAEEKHDYSLGIRVIPVGLNFPSGHLFRSDVLVLVGQPIEAIEFHAMHRNDAKEAVTQLTKAIEVGLEKVTRNVRQVQDAEFIEKLEKIYHEGYLGVDLEAVHPNLKQKFEVDQRVRDAYAYYLEREPDRVNKVRTMIENYLSQVEQHGLRETVIGQYRGLSTLLREAARRLPVFLLASPIWFYGVLTNYPSYRITGILAEKMSVDVVEIATNKILVGMVAHLTYYTALAALVGWWFGWIWGLRIWITFPLSGFMTLELADRMRPFFRTLRATVIFLTQKDLGMRLKVDREKIVLELRSLTEEYQAKHPVPPAASAATGA